MKQENLNYTFFFCKNIFYKTIEAGICQKSKNILRKFEAKIRDNSLTTTNQLLKSYQNPFKTP